MSNSPIFLGRPGGRIAYDVRGDGPLVVCIPGMSDLRSTYRHLVGPLTAAGRRVATFDLRGHGDSDATFDSYDDAAAASDALALVEELGGPAVLVGHSMGAGAAVIAAAQRPDLVDGLVLVGPFVRDPAINVVTRGLFRLAMQPAWIRPVWRAWLPGLHAGRRPDDFEAHQRAVLDALRRPGHRAALARTTHTSHQPAAEVIDRVDAPALVVMGELDKDFPDPAAEARWVADRLAGEVLMVPEAGHYPHSQRADLVAPAVTAFLEEATARAARRRDR